MYTPQHVANFFLDQAENEGRTLDQLKLMKLVYISYGWVLALTGRRLFEEPIVAWQHGPVIRSLYDEFKRFRKAPITSKATQFDFETWDETIPEIDGTDEETRMVLSKVWDAYKRFTGWTLRNKTHERGTPWSSTYDEMERDRVIPDDLIFTHFQAKIREIVANLSAVPA